MIEASGDSNNFHRFLEDGGEAGGTGEDDGSCDLSISGENFLESFAGLFIGSEREDSSIAGSSIAESESVDESRSVEWLQCRAQTRDHSLIGIEAASQQRSVQTVATESSSSLPFVAGAEIDAHNQMTLLESGFLHGRCDVGEGSEFIGERLECVRILRDPPRTNHRVEYGRVLISSTLSGTQSE